MTTLGLLTVTPTAAAASSCLGSESQPLWVEEAKGKEGTAEYLAVLLKQEDKLYPPCNDYLSSLQSSSDSDPVSENWRRKLCEWCYEVVDHFSFDREVVSIALDYLDRSVSKWSEYSDVIIPKREFQLLAVTSLYMAIKLHGETDSTDGPRRKLKIDAFYELSRKQFDVDIIEKTERHILSVLNWNVNPPTALKYIATLLSLCPKWQNATEQTSHANVLGGIYDVARYLTELSVCQSDFSFSHKTSVVAYASILCAIEALSSSMPLPYVVRVRFLNNIAEATGFVSGNADTLDACCMLKKLCPNMFEEAENRVEIYREESLRDVRDISIEQDGKTSPICVIEGPLDNSTRKRSRPEERRRSSM